MAIRRGDNLTIDMWTEFTPPEVTVQLEPEVTKGGTLDVKIARALSHAMQGSDLSRSDIALKMSEYLGGQKVTENMLDTYASPARKDHKITLERFIALVAVTDCHDLLGFVAEFSDFAVVPEEYIADIKIAKTDALIADAEIYRDGLKAMAQGRGRRRLR